MDAFQALRPSTTKALSLSVLHVPPPNAHVFSPCSWDPPECWDVLDPAVLALTEAAAADGISIGDGSGSGVEGGSNDPEGPLTEELSRCAACQKVLRWSDVCAA